MTGKRIEPRDLIWLFTYGLVPNESGLTSDFKLIEKRDPFFNSKLYQDLFGGDSAFGFAKSYINEIGSLIPSNFLSPLIIMKGLYWDHNSTYIVRHGPFHYEKEMRFFYKESPHKFVSIEYTHDEMEEAIELEIDSGWWIIGNELFTPTFVLRALEYQSKSFIFDEYYKIKIMDENFKIMEFGADTYVELTETGYKFKHNPFMTKNEDEYDADSDTDSGKDYTNFLNIEIQEDNERDSSKTFISNSVSGILNEEWCKIDKITPDKKND